MAAHVAEFAVVLDRFQSILKTADEFLRVQPDVTSDLKGFTKSLYDASTEANKTFEISPTEVLPQLILAEGFDDEQIWQQLELQNEACERRFVSLVSKALISQDGRLSKNKTGKVVDADDDDSDNENVEGVTEFDELEKKEEDDDDNNDDDDDEFDQLNKSVGRSGALFDDDEDAMSDISIELEKALDKRIRLDQKRADDEDGDGQESCDDEDEEVDHLLLSVDKPAAADLSNKKGGTRKTVVDDAFFKLSEVENFLDAEDAKEERRLKRLESRKGQSFDEEEEEEEDGIDYFHNEPSSIDLDDHDGWPKDKATHNYKYHDFFDLPGHESGDKRKRTDSATEEENEEEDEDEREEKDSAKKVECKSSFEIRQEKLKAKIAAFEESNLSEKPWQLMGEASASKRPENSLLQEHLNYDHMSRQAPVITEETTFKLEDIIKQRIKDQAFDDVERKIKPKEEPFEYKKRLILDQEKSKLSLAEVYEQEFIKKQQQQAGETEEEEPESHKTIKKEMSFLFRKLDALSNFYFVPKPPVPDVKIVNNLPAIVVEEVAPVSVSDATLLAPEEVKEKSRRELKGKSEATSTDRKSERRRKKKRQAAYHQNKKAKLIQNLKPGMGNKYSKKAALELLKKDSDATIAETQGSAKTKSVLTSSKKFFQKLQEEVSTSIERKRSENKTKKLRKALSAEKAKL